MGSRSDDVLLLEECDQGVRRLAALCGWAEELEDMWAETARAGVDSAERDEKEPVKKSRDEELQDAVDALTRDVENTLRLGKEQHEWLEGHVDRKIARPSGEDKEKEMVVGEERQEGKVVEEGSANMKPPDDPTSKVMAPVRKTEKREGEGSGLGHVFPHLRGSNL